MRRLIPFVLAGCILQAGCPASEQDCPNCLGCCADGVCQPGNTSTACGANGAACSACPAGSACVAGQCKPCDSTTCAQGCCTPDGRCLSVMEQSDVACGGGGGQCRSCGSAKCINGQCQQVSCGPSSCGEGCCDDQGECLPFYRQSATLCGAGGAACASCGPAECVEGQCQGAACGAGNCPQGCCTQEECLAFAQQDGTKCGKGGNACGPCDVGQCVDGQCQSAGCNPTNCQGCCTSQGQCLPLAQQSPTSCGVGGDACVACQPGQPCENGLCKAVCTPATCAQGCCSPQQQCLPFAQQSDGACGLNAGPCQPCGGGNTCTNGKCVKSWKVLVLSAAVSDRPGGWDGSTSISGPEPDPFVVVQVNATGKSGKTNFIDDTFIPVFNQQVLVETEAMLAFGVTCEVKEDDGFLPSESMGICAVPSISPAVLQSGKMVIKPCSGNVIEVVLGFTP